MKKILAIVMSLIIAASCFSLTASAATTIPAEATAPSFSIENIIEFIDDVFEMLSDAIAFIGGTIFDLINPADSPKETAPPELPEIGSGTLSGDVENPSIITPETPSEPTPEATPELNPAPTPEPVPTPEPEAKPEPEVTPEPEINAKNNSVQLIAKEYAANYTGETKVAVIDRNGLETKDYDEETSIWFVYGVDEILNDKFIKDYFEVSQGEPNEDGIVPGGRLELNTRRIPNFVRPYAGTGATIRVYNCNYTPDDTSDDILVEEFLIVIFGDFSGDSSINGIDYSIASDIASGKDVVVKPDTKYTVIEGQTVINPNFALFRALDVNDDGVISEEEAKNSADAAREHTLGMGYVDQFTGKIVY